MKILTISLLIVSGVLFSCQNTAESDIEQVGSDTVVTGLEGTRDQQGQLSGVKTDTTSGQQAAGGVADSATATGTDDQFIKDQITGNYNEIDLAKSALKKSSDKEIKSVAKQLVADHSKVLEKLKAMASNRKLDVASSASVDGTSLVTTLEKKPAAEFDKAWTEAMLEKHKSGIAKYEAAASAVSNADLKAFVNETLPKLRMHLDKLMAYHGQIK